MISRTASYSCSCFAALMAGRNRQSRGNFAVNPAPTAGQQSVTWRTWVWPVLLQYAISQSCCRQFFLLMSLWKIFLYLLFPTCQVRVVRLYQSCCPPLPRHPPPPPTSQLSAHRWTFPAQCAPLDLNLGPSQLSVHRWTSTWDLPSSVCTAGPQRPDRMREDMPDRKL